MSAVTWTTRAIEAPSEDMLDATELAKLLGVSRDTVERMVENGDLPRPLTIGKSMRVWEWRAVTYYRLRLELFARLDPQMTANTGNGPQTTANTGKRGQAENGS